MRVRSETYFFIRGLNQERVLNEISKTAKLRKIDRKTKSETSFWCDYGKSQQIKSKLQSRNIEILQQKNYGILPKLMKILTSYGMLSAFLVFIFFSSFQSGLILKYRVYGTSALSEKSVVSFVKQNFPHKKNRVNLKEIEIALFDKFEEISFSSCMLKGQTLVINIKEKLLPDEVFGVFLPLIAQKNGKITQIDLVSGTPLVKVGDYVRKGDVLVEPYAIDTDGQEKQVRANARIYADVYNVGMSEHFEKRVETYRTGKTCERNEISFCGLQVYSYGGKNKFKDFETEEHSRFLSKNNVLPLKVKKTIYFETATRLIESNFEDEKETYLQKSREKALANCKESDKIIKEYHTIRQLDGVTIVSYCVITQEQIGGFDEN